MYYSLVVVVQLLGCFTAFLELQHFLSDQNDLREEQDWATERS